MHSRGPLFCYFRFRKSYKIWTPTVARKVTMSLRRKVYANSICLLPVKILKPFHQRLGWSLKRDFVPRSLFCWNRRLSENRFIFQLTLTLVYCASNAWRAYLNRCTVNFNLNSKFVSVKVLKGFRLRRFLSDEYFLPDRQKIQWYNICILFQLRVIWPWIYKIQPV